MTLRRSYTDFQTRPAVKVEIYKVEIYTLSREVVVAFDVRGLGTARGGDHQRRGGLHPLGRKDRAVRAASSVWTLPVIVAMEDRKRTPRLSGLEQRELCSVLDDVRLLVPRARLAVEVDEAVVCDKVPAGMAVEIHLVHANHLGPVHDRDGRGFVGGPCTCTLA